MRIVLLYNPIAGAGKAERTARRLEADLAGRGHRMVLATTTPDPASGWLDGPLEGADLLVVVGGDGAVRLAADPAIRAGTPLYHFPLGTENLFSRQFGMTRSVDRLADALDGFRVERIDVGTANGVTFLLMASAGFDAEVVHDLAEWRRGGISHLSYARPILRQLTRWTAPRMSVRIDGVTAVDREAGFLVVANSRQYAQRLDPARRASMTDGQLDVVFFPARSRRELVVWILKCVAGVHLADDRLVYRLGAEVTWTCDPPQRYQVDGDPPVVPAAPAAVSEVRLSLRPGALPVLLPT